MRTDKEDTAMTEQSRQIIIERANKTVWREGDRIVKAFVPGHLKSDVLKDCLLYTSPSPRDRG